MLLLKHCLPFPLSISLLGWVLLSQVPLDFHNSPVKHYCLIFKRKETIGKAKQSVEESRVLRAISPNWHITREILLRLLLNLEGTKKFYSLCGVIPINTYFLYSSVDEVFFMNQETSSHL